MNYLKKLKHIFQFLKLILTKFSGSTSKFFDFLISIYVICEKKVLKDEDKSSYLNAGHLGKVFEKMDDIETLNEFISSVNQFQVHVFRGKGNI